MITLRMSGDTNAIIMDLELYTQSVAKLERSLELSPVTNDVENIQSSWVNIAARFSDFQKVSKCIGMDVCYISALFTPGP